MNNKIWVSSLENPWERQFYIIGVSKSKKLIMSETEEDIKQFFKDMYEGDTEEPPDIPDQNIINENWIQYKWDEYKWNIQLENYYEE